MKCNIPRINSKTRKAIDGYTKHRVAEYYEKQGEEITRRVMKLFCTTLHDDFGFGCERLNKVVIGVSKRIEKSKKDEVFWFHEDRDLNRIGMKFPNEDYEVMDE